MKTTRELTFDSPIRDLSARTSKSLEALDAAGIKTIFDLMWVIPLRVHRIPPMGAISSAQDGKYFRGMGKVISFQSRPNFRARGKGRVPLNNLTVVMMDLEGNHTIQLKWFNCYPSVVSKLKGMNEFAFAGIVQSFQGTMQIVSPEVSAIGDEISSPGDFLIQYPTVNGVSSPNIKKLIDKVPHTLWESQEAPIPAPKHLPSLLQALRVLHAKIEAKDWNEDARLQARDSLAYHEFFFEQIKHRLRKKRMHHSPAVIMKTNEEDIDSLAKFLPYTLTSDQSHALKDILNDFSGPGPMMRLIQGDVGCGKTTVALLSAFIVIQKGHQAAFMAPTESLAFQHFKTISLIAQKAGIKTALLLGSTPNAQKLQIQNDLLSGEIQLVIGTHSLFQDSVNYKSLALAIIDEQHKFGVNQRLKLVGKTQGCHCLLMTATPIPRSLSLTQYGDLDISVIKTLPGHRRGFKTRIVSPETYPKFLSFLKTRQSLGEQAYIVVPAIEESEGMDMANLNDALSKFKGFFPDLRVEGLHGQLKSDEKQQVLTRFYQGEIDILVSTSVVEVGIDVENATVMAILNPERFGLSSLHQLRGRVGRGSKPGFCFLVCEKIPTAEAFERLRVIENTDDGFKIAEEDLRIRGEGDLFGTNQSGSEGFRRVANIVTDYELLELAREEVEKLSSKPDFLEMPLVKRMARNDHVVYTV